MYVLKKIKENCWKLIYLFYTIDGILLKRGDQSSFKISTCLLLFFFFPHLLTLVAFYFHKKRNGAPLSSC